MFKTLMESRGPQWYPEHSQWDPEGAQCTDELRCPNKKVYIVLVRAIFTRKLKFQMAQNRQRYGLQSSYLVRIAQKNVLYRSALVLTGENGGKGRKPPKNFLYQSDKLYKLTPDPPQSGRYVTFAIFLWGGCWLVINPFKRVSFPDLGRVW